MQPSWAHVLVGKRRCHTVLAWVDLCVPRYAFCRVYVVTLCYECSAKWLCYYRSDRHNRAPRPATARGQGGCRCFAQKDQRIALRAVVYIDTFMSTYMCFR